MKGRQAEAIKVCDVNSGVRNRRDLQVRTLEAVTNSFTSGRARSPSKSTNLSSRSRSGLSFIGLSCAGDQMRVMMSSIMKAGSLSTAHPSLIPGIPRITLRGMPARSATPFQNRSSASIAPCRRPLRNPSANTTAFIAPALVPLIPSI